MKCRCLAFRLHSVNCYQLIYLLIASLHCDCNQGKTGCEVYFWINPIYCNFNTLLILKFCDSLPVNLVFVNSLVLYFNTKTKFSLFRETLMKYPSSLKVSAPWWCDISPWFQGRAGGGPAEWQVSNQQLGAGAFWAGSWYLHNKLCPQETGVILSHCHDSINIR